MLAGRVFKDREWLLEFFRREWSMLKESWVVEKWIQEGIKKGIQQGRTEGITLGWNEGIEQGVELGLRQAVIAALRARFELVPRDLIRALGEVSEKPLLE